MSDTAVTAEFRTWMCVVCGFIYDEALGLPLLAEIPMLQAIREGGDAGQFTLTRGGFPLSAVTVNLGLGGPGAGFATAGIDHSNLPATVAFAAACLAGIWWIFRTGYRLKA